MPIPIVVLLAVLLGYPAVQLFAAMIARPKKRELARLVSEIKADPRYSKEDLRILEWASSPEQMPFVAKMVIPFLAPVAAMSATIEVLRESTSPIDIRALDRVQLESLKKLAELHETGGSANPMWQDPRLPEVLSRCSTIEMLRVPLTLALSALTILGAIPLLMMIVGVKASFSVEAFIKQTLRRAFTAIHFGTEGITFR